MIIDIRNDSAGCCGIKHILGAGNTLSRLNIQGADAKRAARLFDDASSLYRGVLLTMSLTNQQIRAHREIIKVLMKDYGWVLVTRFNNPNSGNIVNVFHRTNRLRTAGNQHLGRQRPANQGVNSK